MCWSFEASVGAALIGLPPLAYLWYRNWKYDRAFAFFMTVIISMQIIEAILWKNQECNKANDIASKVAIIQNFLQPYAMIIALFFLIPNMKTNWFGYGAASIYIVAFTGVMIWYISQNKLFKQDYCSIANCDGYCHMTWQWTQFDNASTRTIWPLHVLWLALPLLVLQNVPGLVFTVLAGLSLWLGSIVTNRTGQRGSAASMWCWFAAGFPFLYIAVTTYLQKPK